MQTPIFDQGFEPHNHESCIDTAIDTARKVCENRGVKLTTLREQVLTLVWSSHCPLGAYKIMDMLGQQTTRRIAPPTVYRALDFLVDQKLIHKIHTLNAFTGCSQPLSRHQNHFLICEHCQMAVEWNCEDLKNSIRDNAATAGFEIHQQSLEIVGLCSNCQESRSDHE